MPIHARSSPPAPPRVFPWPTILTIVAVFYGAFLFKQMGPYAGGADSSGYFNSAKLMMNGELTTPMRLPAGVGGQDYGIMVFMPLGFVEHGTNALVPSYPPGLPLHFALLGKLVGIPLAMQCWNLFFALGGGALVYLLARELRLSPGWAAAGTLIFWSNPLTLFLAIQPMSDLPAFFWCSLALLSALRGRASWRWALLAGLATGIAVLVRPSNVLLALPLLLALAWAWKKMFAVVVGGLLPALFQVWYNQQITGSPLSTGYGDVSTAFAWENVWPSLRNVGLWVPGILSPLIAVGLAGTLFSSTVRSRTGLTLAGWLVTLTGFYLFYYHTREHWWYLRFIYPCFGALLVLALAGGKHWLELVRWERPRWPLLIAMAALVFALGWTARLTQNLFVLHISDGEVRYRESARITAEKVPANAAVFCMQSSGALFHYTDLMIIRWDTPSAEAAAGLQTVITAQKRPIYAVLFDFEEPEALQKLGGSWAKVGPAGNTTIWRKEIP